MKSNAHNNSDKNLRVINSLLLGVVAITIYFKTDLQDPFNSPKMWILFLLTAWLLGSIFTSINIIKVDKNLKYLFVILALFNLVMLIDALNTDNTTTAFFGEIQRRNGFLTYFCMSIVLLSSAIFLKFNNIRRLFIAAFLTGLIIGIYGLMQHNGKDFVKWVNNYNSIIGTLGNPNFAAALMAVVATIVFGIAINSSFNLIYRLSSLILVGLLLTVIYLSHARQGLISMFVGIGLSMLIYIYSWNKKIGILSLVGGSLFSIAGILGMLQIGPLTNLLYKPTVSVRGYYWRAGISMMKDNPLFGVGIDRYGAYFKQYRETGYSLSYGMEITSTNAHNTPIQFFATGGIPLGLMYLLMLSFVFYVGVKGLVKSKGNERLILGSIFSAWVAFHSQSLVSIDNIGISIWGFLLAGAIVALSLDILSINEPNKNLKITNRISESKKLFQPILSIMLLIPAIILVSQLHRGESDMFKLKSSFNPTPGADNKVMRDFAIKTLKDPFLNEYSKLDIAISLENAGYTTEAIKTIQDVRTADPRSLDALNLLSLASFQLKDINKAIDYRKEITKLDPWNAENYLQLGRYYKSNGDSANMIEMLNKIMSFAPNTDQAKIARSELILDKGAIK
jgi:O-antigen ligase